MQQNGATSILVIKLLQHSSHAIRKFRDYGLVHASLCLLLDVRSVITFMYENSAIIQTAKRSYIEVTVQEFCMMGGYMEDVAKTLNCRNCMEGEVGLEMGACSGQYGTSIYLLFESLIIGCAQTCPNYKFFDTGFPCCSIMFKRLMKMETISFALHLSKMM